MQAQGTERPRDGLVIARGYGVKVYVGRGHLIVHDGVGRQRQTRRYHRAVSRLRRLVILSTDGYVTLEALSWLRETKAALVQIDPHGNLIAATVPAATDHAELRRAQAIAATNPSGLEVSRVILARKLHGQAAIANDLTPASPHVRSIERAITDLQVAGTIQALLAAEARAAEAYWAAWTHLPLNISKGSRGMPDHWTAFSARHSPLSASPRLAVGPVNAILNYLYALLEGETVIACHTLGLDPGLALFHADRNGRNSFALDLMEASRPAVDAYTLGLLSETCLSSHDFVETPRGECRLAPRLAHQLAETTSTWAAHIAPIAEDVAQIILEPSGRGMPTRLTRNKRLASVRGPTLAALPRRCSSCGEPISRSAARLCSGCREEGWEQDAARGRSAARDVLTRLRAAESDPAHGGEAAVSRGRKNAAHQRAVRDWTGPLLAPEHFATEVLPSLRGLPIAVLVAATGLSPHYCSLIRLGKKVPHQRHWVPLAKAGR